MGYSDHSYSTKIRIAASNPRVDLNGVDIWCLGLVYVTQHTLSEAIVRENMLAHLSKDYCPQQGK